MSFLCDFPKTYNFPLVLCNEMETNDRVKSIYKIQNRAKLDFHSSRAQPQENVISDHAIFGIHAFTIITLNTISKVSIDIYFGLQPYTTNLITFNFMNLWDIIFQYISFASLKNKAKIYSWKQFRF